MSTVKHERLNIPNTCPICKHAVHPRFAAQTPWIDALNPDEPRWMDVAYVCPRNECSRMFVSIYKCTITGTAGIQKTQKYEFEYSIPNLPTEPIHDEEIKSVSSNFVELYRQASDAESYRLGDIAGVAYRKALEFLIKDYCIKKTQMKKQK